MTKEQLEALGEKLVLGAITETDTTITGDEARRLMATLELVKLTCDIDKDSMLDRWLCGILRL